MKAKNRERFVNRWNECIDEFARLMHSAETVEAMDEIKAAQEMMREVVNKVADECYED